MKLIVSTHLFSEDHKVPEANQESDQIQEIVVEIEECYVDINTGSGDTGEPTVNFMGEPIPISALPRPANGPKGTAIRLTITVDEALGTAPVWIDSQNRSLVRLTNQAPDYGWPYFVNAFDRTTKQAVINLNLDRPGASQLVKLFLVRNSIYVADGRAAQTNADCITTVGVIR